MNDISISKFKHIVLINFLILLIMTKIYKFVLIIFSIMNLAKVKLLGINKANYFIIDNKNLIDKRSLHFFDSKDCKLTLNLVRLTNLNFKNFKNVFRIPNFFCYSIIKDLFIIRLNNKDFEKLISNIFSYLNIKKFLLIDDKREMLFFSKLAKKNNINTLIYMHGRLSRISDNQKNFLITICLSNFF